MVSVTFLKVCCQSDVSFSCRRNALQLNELSPSTKYVLYPEYKYLHVNLYTYIHYDS